MVKWLFCFFQTLQFLQFLSVAALAVEVKPLRTIPATLAFETAVPNPILLSLCGGKMWTFSESEQALVGLDPTAGKIVMSVPIKVATNGVLPVEVAAISCQVSRLMVLVNHKKGGSILEFHVDNNKVHLEKKYPLPMKGRATDLFCNPYECWILQDRPMITYDFKKWMEVWAPFRSELKKVYAHPDLNPFEDWQASLNLAKGQYWKGAIDRFGQFVLLDPFHSQAIIRTGAEWQKWGNFGVWEGSFLSPKAITFVAENTLAVADAKLKAIFIYRRDGVYLGVLSVDADRIFAPDYPMGLAMYEGRLFVADFRGNKISALDLRNLDANYENVSENSVRQNLFRREEVLKDAPSTLCLNCHDGTISNQLHKFVSLKIHHPLECSQCHDPHHNILAQHYLRKPPQELCQSCHKDYSDLKTNHLWNKKSGVSCMDCHRSHTNNKHLLITPAPEICISCHRNQPIDHKSVADMVDIEAGKNILLQQGKFNCLTCHQTHINWKDSHFVREPQKVVNFCSSCHGQKSLLLYKDFHKIMKKKRGGHS